MLQLAFIGAIPHSLISGPKGWAGIPSTSPVVVGPFAGLAGLVGLAWLAVLLRIDAFVSPFGTGLIYDDRPRASATAWPATGTSRSSSPRSTGTASRGSA